MFAVTSTSELVLVTDPLARAAQANELMWTDHPERVGLRTLRARAIREALATGRPASEVAARLGVAVADLTWMERETRGWPHRPDPADGTA
jgi:hypothetical protein